MGSLAELEAWPSWAGHIRRMQPDPPGELTSTTEVMLHMRAGPSTRMAVTEHDPPSRWVWEGTSYGVTTIFEHRFEVINEATTRIWFLAWMHGPLARPVGWFFRRIMRRNLARALPRLKTEIEASETETP